MVLIDNFIEIILFVQTKDLLFHTKLSIIAIRAIAKTPIHVHHYLV